MLAICFIMLVSCCIEFGFVKSIDSLWLSIIIGYSWYVKYVIIVGFD